MSNSRNIEFDNDEFRCVIEDNVAVLTIKGNAFTSISSVARNHDIIPWINSVETSSEVRGILVMNEDESMSDKSYVDFLKDTIGNDFDPYNPKEVSRFVKSEIRMREITILGNIISRVLDFRKILIFALNGEIVSPFFGLSLSGDFRFASSDAMFMVSHIKYRLHPSGALPYFLPQFLNPSQVSDILFRGDKINAEELKKLRLVNEVFPKSEFIERAKQEAIEICKVSLNVVKSTKKLLHRDQKAFNQFLNSETEFMTR